jgi:hypothetical protein
LTDRIKIVSNVTTPDIYAALITVRFPYQMDKLLIHLKEENSNDVLFKIEVAQDEYFVKAETLKPEQRSPKMGVPTKS